MKNIKLCIAFVSFVFTSLIGVPAVVAQDSESDNVHRLYYIEVKAGHGLAFRTAWNGWKGCLDKNGGGNFSFTALVPETGKLSGILLRTGSHNWADFDEEDPAALACNSLLQTTVVPHTVIAQSRFTRSIPYARPAIEGEIKIIRLFDIDVKSVPDAVEMIKEFQAAEIAAGIGERVWSRNATSFGDWNIRFAVLRTGYADFPSDGSGFWERQAAHHGEEKAAALRERWRANNNKGQNSIWRRATELDYSSTKE